MAADFSGFSKFSNFSDYKKIIVIGSAGSGKSWLSKKLALITGYPLIHLDNEFWQPGWTETPRDQWIEKQKGFISGDSWIIDGNYGSTLEIRFSAADLIVFLDIGRLKCVLSAVKRHGRKRSDLPQYLEEKLDFEFFKFLKWIWDFPKNGRKDVLNLHKKHPEKRFIIIKSRKETELFLKELQRIHLK